jgi:acyl-CoA thioesterase FadM
MFALEQFLTYRREVLVGDEVAVHLRLLDREPRMLHLVSYLVNHTRSEVAASMESLEAYVDYSTRKMAPFPDEAGRRLDELIARNAELLWQPELTGAIALPGAKQ